MIEGWKAEKKHEKLKTYWSEESRLTQKCLIGILEKLESMETLLKAIQEQGENQSTGEEISESEYEEAIEPQHPEGEE